MFCEPGRALTSWMNVKHSGGGGVRQRSCPKVPKWAFRHFFILHKNNAFQYRLGQDNTHGGGKYMGNMEPGEWNYSRDTFTIGGK